MARTRQNRNERPKASALSDSDKAIAGISEISAHKTAIAKSGPIAQTEDDASRLDDPDQHSADNPQPAAARESGYARAVTPIDSEPAGVRPGAAQATDFRFFIDSVSDKQIEGWVIRTGLPSHRCVVVLREGDRSLARVIASRFRADLASAGIGDGHHSFVIPTPPALRDGGEHLLEIVEEESGIRLTHEPMRWRAERAAAHRAIDGMADDERDAGAPEPPDGSPAGVQPGAAQATDFRFYIDEVSDKQIEGWIIRTEQPLRRCVVALREGDHILARAIASRFRADLTSAGIGDGHHSFAIPTPPPLLDGEEHLLEIVEQESGIRLTPGPIRWRAERAATHRAIDGMGAGLGRQISLETQSRLTSARSDTGAAHPFVPEAERVTSAGSEAPAPTAVGTRILLETKDFRSLVAFYTCEITFQLAQSSRRPERTGRVTMGDQG
jgi:hypothetical protein